MKEKLNIFLNGLSDDTRNRVGQGDSTTSFYQRYVEEAYLMLDDMAEFYYWNCSMSNLYYENNSIYSEPENWDNNYYTPQCNIKPMKSSIEDTLQEFLDACNKLN